MLNLLRKLCVISVMSATKRQKGATCYNFKIRNLLAMTADIYNEVIGSQDDKLSNEIRGKINYLKIRFVYEAGRETKVKTLVEKAEILHHIDDIKDSRTQFILFSRYMEALVAYRKFIGGHDE